MFRVFLGNFVEFCTQGFCEKRNANLLTIFFVSRIGRHVP